jgi:hypothetical protein
LFTEAPGPACLQRSPWLTIFFVMRIVAAVQKSAPTLVAALRQITQLSTPCDAANVHNEPNLERTAESEPVKFALLKISAAIVRLANYG